MLVCSVSMRPSRRAIAADIAEAAAALDGLTTGSVVFATLVDDPASVGDTLDAYLGEIMLEAASATDSFSAGAGYDATVDETVTAADTPDAITTTTPATWNPSDILRATLSNGNLTVTTTASNNGCV